MTDFLEYSFSQLLKLVAFAFIPVFGVSVYAQEIYKGKAIAGLTYNLVEDHIENPFN